MINIFKQKIINLIGFILLIVAISSCGSKKNTLFYQKTDKKYNKSVYYLNADSNSTFKFDLEQKILPGHNLNIRNLQNETQVLGYVSGADGSNISINYPVEADSTVTLPFLGKVKLGGLTIPFAEAYLNKAYSKDLLKNPIIKISITNFTVTVLGEFNKQGQIILKKNNAHLTELLGEVGGLNNRANIRNIKIIRGSLKNPDVIMINLNDFKSLSDERLYLKNNDIIYAQTSNYYKFQDKLGSTTTLVSLLTGILSIYLLTTRL